MMGFFRRDLSLQRVNGGFYLCFVLAFALLSIFSDFSAGFVSLYLVIFSGSSIMSLFSYDEINHWEAYAAAVPNGRRAIVDARYVMALLLAGVVFLLQTMVGVLQRANLLGIASVYAGALLFYAAVVLPIFYRFGGTRSRVIIIVVIALFSILVAFCTSALQSVSGDILQPGWDRFLSVLAPVAGLALLAISHRISRAIMARKEL